MFRLFNYYRITRANRFFGTVREKMDYDVVIVGAGPAGLSSAIRLKQLAQQHNRELSVCVVEKGAEVGAHILSGNVFDPKALNELIPDWKEKGAPLHTPVTRDLMYFLTKHTAIPLPVPPTLHNHGNYVISLGQLVRWLATQAEGLGVEIYPGFSASEVLYNDKHQVVGIATSDMGVGKDGTPRDGFTPGMELRAKQTFFAEGCRGSLSEEVMSKFQLRKDCDPQTYGIGFKEVWEVDKDNDQFRAGQVLHTVGWPVPDNKTWMGSYVYHMQPNQVLIGLVVGLDYPNPYLNPYMEFQRFKHHGLIKQILKGGKCISYGARALNEGGYQSIPKLAFPGGALIGCSAGFLNVPKIKGSHYAMKSGMLAADALFERLQQNPEQDAESLSGAELSSYEPQLRASWVGRELWQVRNIHPALHQLGFGLWTAYSALETFLLKGRTPWTFHNDQQDFQRTRLASASQPIKYEKPDGVLSFDLLSNLQRSGVYHEEDQPVHLKIKPELKHVPETVSYQQYAAPESRFCPAKVYEYVPDEHGRQKLVINSQNCIHCKTCDIKSPQNYIKWTVPQGGGGPQYGAM